VKLVSPSPKGWQAEGVSRLPTKHEDWPFTSKQTVSRLPLQEQAKPAQALSFLYTTQALTLLFRSGATCHQILPFRSNRYE
jgi:hypothetical protein